MQLFADVDHNKNIWVAYSGGVDSHVLLHLARQYFSSVQAIHINHGAQAADDAYQEHCTQICAQLNVPLQCIKVALHVNAKTSFETAARNARRNAWRELLTDNDVLLLGHHADDQAETILYRLLRGTGPVGLSGMQQFSRLGALTLARPLLNMRKAEILQYAKEHQLQYIDDVSNHADYDRNYLRNKVMPLLQGRWPAAVNNINRAGDISRALQQTIVPEVTLRLHSMLQQDNTLDLRQFAQLDQFWQQQVLRAFLRRFALIPSAQQLDIILQQLVGARRDARPQVRLGKKVLKRSNHKLHVLDFAPDPTAAWQVSWDLTQDLALPNGQQLQAHQIFTAAQMRAIAPDSVTVRLGSWGRKAKKVFQQHAVPPWQRGNYPVVFVGNRFFSVVGLCHPAKASVSSAKASVSSAKGESVIPAKRSASGDPSYNNHSDRRF